MQIENIIFISCLSMVFFPFFNFFYMGNLAKFSKEFTISRIYNRKEKFQLFGQTNDNLLQKEKH